MKIKECHPDWYYPVQGMRTLILGTFPPHPDKRHYEFYYPNRQNRFWGVMPKLRVPNCSKLKGQKLLRNEKG
jgi:G:T/U-mismatch repair DNA glycosylase